MAAFVDGEPLGKQVDLGPLVGAERGFMTREKVPLSGGTSGVEMVPTSQPATPWIETPNSELPVLTLSPATTSPSPKKSATWKGKARAVDCGESESESSALDSPGVVHPSTSKYISSISSMLL
jgi:hypothetical protein